MKNSVIKGIFHGFRGNVEAMNTKEINKKNQDILINSYESLKKQLNSKQYDLFENYTNALEISYSDEIDFYFTEGFKLGLQIGVECLDDN